MQIYSVWCGIMFTCVQVRITSSCAAREAWGRMPISTGAVVVVVAVVAVVVRWSCSTTSSTQQWWWWWWWWWCERADILH